MANYDEDLYENPFFLTIHKQFTALFNEAAAKKALVCIPKYSSCSRQSITEADVSDHILFPEEVGEGEEDESGVHKTLSGKVVVIKDKALHTKEGFEHVQSVKLLFEETFHSENDNSYRVLCVQHFLNRLPVHRKDSVKREDQPSTYAQCVDLLWNHSGGQKARDNLDKMMNAFADVYDSLEGENLRSVVDMTSAHFTKAMQLLLRDSVVRRSVKHNPMYMDSLKIAVETYMTNAVHVRLFRVVTALMASEDAEINKTTRNLASLQLQDMGIRKIFSQNIPPAKKELAGLNRFSTPMGRLFCVKRVVTALTRPLKQAGKLDDNSTTLMTTDDFLPILIFLIIKSEIPNWMANLVYMRHFHLAKSSDDDEFGFYLASVEAALEHIKSGYISQDMKVNKPKREGWSFLELSPGHSDSTDGSTGALQRQDSAFIDQFFLSVQEGEEGAVRGMLQKPQRTSDEVHLKLCHPLCSCDRCDKILSASRNDSDLVTAYTRDNKGYTALHMAAYHGQGTLIDLLIQSGAVVDATDYLGLTPLHLACQRGYQNVMLLLLHFEADVTCRDNEGNMALHHCCLNGHEDCVKALIFYDGSLRRLQVNTVNELGDTALHMAAKWGYESIVKCLLENGANATIKNRKRQSPVHVAQNVKVQRLLQSSTQGLELQPVSSFVPVASGSKGRASSSSSSGGGGDLVQQDVVVAAVTAVAAASGAVEMLVDEMGPSRVETASLDEAQDKQLKKRKDKLFRAIVAGDIQLVKFYLGLQGGASGQADDDEDEEDDSPTTAAKVSLGVMCHPLCQCHKCLSIQKAQTRAHQALSVNVKTTSGYTPLHMAVLHGHDDLVRLFLEHGAHASSQNHKNLTPLHIASCLRKLLTMELLLNCGAKVNIRDINGDAPLLICSASGFSEGVQILLKRGADVNVSNHRGNSSLHEAADHSHLSIVLTLLAAGADPTLRNKQTKTAFNMARVPPIQRELQAAMTVWQEKHQKPPPDTRPRASSQRVVGQSQVSVQELFAAFEEDDLKTLQSLTAAIRGFHQQGSLKKAVTRDHSRSFLGLIAHRSSIESFDQSLLRSIQPGGRSFSESFDQSHSRDKSSIESFDQSQPRDKTSMESIESEPSHVQSSLGRSEKNAEEGTDLASRIPGEEDRRRVPGEKNGEKDGGETEGEEMKRWGGAAESLTAHKWPTTGQQVLTGYPTVDADVGDMGAVTDLSSTKSLVSVNAECDVTRALPDLSSLDISSASQSPGRRQAPSQQPDSPNIPSTYQPECSTGSSPPGEANCASENLNTEQVCSPVQDIIVTDCSDKLEVMRRGSGAQGHSRDCSISSQVSDIFETTFNESRVNGTRSLTSQVSDIFEPTLNEGSADKNESPSNQVSAVRETGTAQRESSGVALPDTDTDSLYNTTSQL